MNQKLFWLGFGGILILGLLLRIIPLWNNNFFFTYDQGYDAVFAREIWQRGQLLLHGPVTGIAGIYTQPLWFYLVALGYKLAGGHPVGPVLLLIFLNLSATALLMLAIKHQFSTKPALLVGISLQFFWPFYDTSRYTFNPFPLVFLSILVILLLIKFQDGQKKFFFLALIPIILAFNFEVAAAGALLAFYLAIAIWAIKKKLLNIRRVIITTFIALLLISPIIVNFLSVFWHTRLFPTNSINSIGTFAGTNFFNVAREFGKIIQNSTIPQLPWLGTVLFAITMFFFFRKQTAAKIIFAKHFIILALILLAVSYLWFGASRGWKDWHTIYLPPLLFTSLLLALSSFKNKFSAIIIGIVLISQGLLFTQRFMEYLAPSADESILANQLAALDWIYTHNEHDGFSAYTFSPLGYDYPYQYLFWWYGRNKYGFVPCEYATHPHLLEMKKYVPGSLFYNEPKLGCDKFRFLIMEPGGEETVRQKWLDKLRSQTQLLETTTIGKIEIEKRIIK